MRLIGIGVLKNKRTHNNTLDRSGGSSFQKLFLSSKVFVITPPGQRDR
jgi:hypothetical protein